MAIEKVSIYAVGSKPWMTYAEAGRILAQQVSVDSIQVYKNGRIGYRTSIGDGKLLGEAFDLYDTAGDAVAACRATLLAQLEADRAKIMALVEAEPAILEYRT